jgi:hypothetical protein
MAMSKDEDSASAAIGVVVVVVVDVVVVWFSMLSDSACDKVQMARDTVSDALLVVQNTSKSSSGSGGCPFPVAALRLANAAVD